jgi:hypothetical protein
MLLSVDAGLPVVAFHGAVKGHAFGLDAGNGGDAAADFAVNGGDLFGCVTVEVRV